ncbi:uncharacterized protein G2W53_035000 [Senna tora]|uniref:Uncharacterized protein n=1 Tax=Senna tora TaxID=362788 RepID=A0A834SR32_9FABA|nr:uncharacterized protein G2W53_035000 [Senna tora]
MAKCSVVFSSSPISILIDLLHLHPLQVQLIAVEEEDDGWFDGDNQLGIADIDLLLNVDYDHYFDDADLDVPEVFYEYSQTCNISVKIAAHPCLLLFFNIEIKVRMGKSASVPFIQVIP